MLGLRSLLLGLRAPLVALPFVLRTPSVLLLVVVPLLVNIALSVVFFSYLSGLIAQYIDLGVAAMGSHVPVWLASLSYWGMKITAFVMLLLLSASVFTVVGGLLAAPFNDALSRRTSRMLNQKRKGAVAAAALAVVDGEPKLSEVMVLELKRTLVLLLAGGFAFLLGLVPFMQLPAICIAAYVLAFEYFGFPIGRKSTSLFKVWSFIVRRPLVSLGFGLALLVLMALPLVSVLYMPLAVVAGTMIYENER